MKPFEYINRCQDSYIRIDTTNYERALELILLEHRILGVLYFHRELRERIHETVKASLKANHARPIYLYYKRADDLFNRYWGLWHKEIKLHLFLSHLKLVAFEEYCKRRRIKTPKYQFGTVVNLRRLKNLELEEASMQVDERHFGLDKEDLSEYVIDYEKEKEERDALLELIEWFKSGLEESDAEIHDEQKIETQAELDELNEINFELLIETIGNSIEPSGHNSSGFFFIKRYISLINYHYYILDGQSLEEQIDNVRNRISQIDVPGLQVTLNEVEVQGALVQFECKIHHNHVSGYEVPINFEVLDSIVDVK